MDSTSLVGRGLFNYLDKTFNKAGVSKTLPMGSYLNSGKLVSLLVLLIALLLGAAAHAQTDSKELVAKGQYIFSLAAGCACHSGNVTAAAAAARRAR